MATSKWSVYRAQNQDLVQKAKGMSRNKDLAQLSQAVLRFNTLAQGAYDSAVKKQKRSIAGAIASKFAKATLKEVVSNAIGTFGPGAIVDGAFSDISMGGGTEKLSQAWSLDNFSGKGVDYTFGANGGWMTPGDSGLSRLSENAIKAGIGFVLGEIQGKLEDATYDQFGHNDSERVKDYIHNNIDPNQSFVFGAHSAMKQKLPDLNSENTDVKNETGAHQAKEREGTGDLIKEAVHQIDQLCYALNELEAMDRASTTWAQSGGTFRKCREMVEFMGKMYWFRRKYNKTRHFMHKLKEDYVAVGMVMQDMEKFWQKNLRAFEVLAMRAAMAHTGVAKSSGGSRVHLHVEEFGFNSTDPKYAQDAAVKGQRNWRKV